jgi:hypothetical protein
MSPKDVNRFFHRSLSPAKCCEDMRESRNIQYFSSRREGVLATSLEKMALCRNLKD